MPCRRQTRGDPAQIGGVARATDGENRIHDLSASTHDTDNRKGHGRNASMISSTTVGLGESPRMNAVAAGPSCASATGHLNGPAAARTNSIVAVEERECMRPLDPTTQA